jgi:DTW domain-containing protein YfiP
VNNKPSKINRKRKTQNPCFDCGLPEVFCLCPEITPLDLKTHLTLVIHQKEVKRTTNTGKLALKALKNSSLITRGLPENPINLLDHLLPNYQPLLLYPSDDATELTTGYLESIQKPIQLLVPDGNWRQASKVHYRHNEIRNIPRVILPKNSFEFDQMRVETKPEGMPTMAAIAYALGVIESLEVRDSLLNLLSKKQEITLRRRGMKS